MFHWKVGDTVRLTSGVVAALSVLLLGGRATAAPDGSQSRNPLKLERAANLVAEVGTRSGLIAAPSCLGRTATIVGNSTDEEIQGTARADVIAALGGSDSIAALSGNDRVCGGAGNEAIGGGRGDDLVQGGYGNDLMAGHSGADTLLGGAANDGFSGGPGNDLIDGQAGVDHVLYSFASARVTVNLTTGRASGGGGSDTLLRVEDVFDSPFDDRIIGDGGPNDLFVQGGSDTVSAREGRDTVLVWDPDGAGDDIANGGAGVDTCTVNPGDTVLNCEEIEVVP